MPQHIFHVGRKRNLFGGASAKMHQYGAFRVSCWKCTPSFWWRLPPSMGKGDHEERMGCKSSPTQSMTKDVVIFERPLKSFGPGLTPRGCGGGPRIVDMRDPVKNVAFLPPH